MTWLRRSRFGHWVHFLALPLAGYDGRAGASAVAAAARGVIVAFALLAFGYVLNGLADRRMDRSPKNHFAGDSASPRGAFTVLAALVSLVVLASTPAPLPARIATALCLASAVAYSVGPRLKRFPVVGSLANLTNFVPLLWVGVVDAGEPRAIGVLAVAFGCLLLQNQLLHEAADRGEDSAGGVRTTVMLLGREGSAMAAAALGLLAVLAAWRAGISPWLPALVYVAGFPLVLARSGDDERRMAYVRVAHRAFSIVFGAALFAVR